MRSRATGRCVTSFGVATFVISSFGITRFGNTRCGSSKLRGTRRFWLAPGLRRRLFRLTLSRLRLEIGRLEGRRFRARCILFLFFTSSQFVAHPFTHVGLVTQWQACGQRWMTKVARSSRPAGLGSGGHRVRRRKSSRGKGEENDSKRNSRAAIHFTNNVSPERCGGSYADMVCGAGRETIRQDSE